MELPTVDPRLSVQQALQDDPVQRKLQIDALKERLANKGDEAAARKLKDACQGFESIFLQKIWEQMRKNVGKEGFLHSRDEESYQSMFDQELARKMAEAGGIGLADMLEQQLSVKLGKASIATSPEMLKNKQKLLPLEDLGKPVPMVPGFNDKIMLKAENAPLGKPEPVTADPRKVAESPKAESATAKADPKAALSAAPSLAGFVTQPPLGMQNQFMLGANLAARITADNSAKPQNAAAKTGQNGNPFASNENLLAAQPSATQAPGARNQRAEIAQALNISDAGGETGGQGLPPLPRLDNAPGAGETNPGAPDAAPHRAQRALGFNGMSSPDDTVKKSNLNPFSQNWPLPKARTSSNSGGRFVKPGAQQVQERPELGKAVLDEPSILQAPAQSVSRFRAPRNEADLNDAAASAAPQLKERHHVTAVRDVFIPNSGFVQNQIPGNGAAPVRDVSQTAAPQPQQPQNAETAAGAVQVNAAQNPGIRQISQKEFEDALRRMN